MKGGLVWQSFFSFLGGLFSGNRRLEDRSDFTAITDEYAEIIQVLKAEIVELRGEITTLKANAVDMSKRIGAEERRTIECEEGRKKDTILIMEMRKRIEYLEAQHNITQ